MSLIQLIYVSAAREEFSQEALERILESAVRHNQEQDITGMLLYSEASFMQVLEGEEEAVKETISRIMVDARHRNIDILVEMPVNERSFSQWSMGFRQLGAKDAREHPGYAPFFERGFDAKVIGAKPGVALDILLDFSQRERLGR